MPKKRSTEDEYPDVVGSRLRGMAAAASRQAPPPPAPVVEEPEEARRPEPEQQPAPVRSTIPASRSPKRRSSGGERRSTGEFLQQHKARFTEAEAAANEEIVAAIARALGTKPSQASLTRALWTILRDCEEAVLRSRSRNNAPRLNRPPNGFGVETVEYERRLAQYLRQLIREHSEM